jgi:hypothetical protein
VSCFNLNVTLAGGLTLNLVQQPLPAPQGKIFLAVMVDGITVIGDANTMDTKIPEGKRIKLEVRPSDVSGNPAPIDGNVTWTSADDTLLQVIPDAASANQTQAWVQNAAGGALGPTQIQISADADMGTGITTITQAVDFEAVAGQAATFGVDQIGTLEDIPPP